MKKTKLSKDEAKLIIKCLRDKISFNKTVIIDSNELPIPDEIKSNTQKEYAYENNLLKALIEVLATHDIIELDHSVPDGTLDLMYIVCSK